MEGPSEKLNEGKPEEEKVHHDDSTRKKPKKAARDRFCKLCEIPLNSVEQLRSHFSGRKHINKGKLKKDIPSVNDVPDEQEPPKKKMKYVAMKYCQTCDISLTSQKHYEQHYLGRNHKRMIHGKAPLSKGYQNIKSKQWTRQPVDPRVATRLLGSALPEDLIGRAASSDDNKVRGKFWCSTCFCAQTSEAQHEAHMKGSKHRKNLQRIEINGVLREILDSKVKSAPKYLMGVSMDDHLVGYYCDPCKTNVRSVLHLHNHISHKNHQLKVLETFFPGEVRAFMDFQIKYLTDMK